jgi:uncharacterized protein Yka (UPF0111/DUF47 family)
VAFRPTFHDVRFVDLMMVQADSLVQAGQLLAEVLVGDQSLREDAAGRLQGIDQTADRQAHAVLRAMAETFVVPFDRSDVYRVSWALRRGVARMDAVADEIVLFQVGEVPSGMSELVRLTIRSADITREAIQQLPRPAAMTDPWIELVRLSKQSGREHRRFIGEITTTVTDPASLVRWGCLAQGLRELSDSFDEIADALQTVAVKEA